MAIQEFAEHYTAAWCSHDPARVAECYGKEGSLTINDGEPAVGREAIAATALDFMNDFPDLVIECEGLEEQDNRVLYRWSLEGTHVETGRPVHISGEESWRIGEDGLIAESRGHFDEAEYQRQLNG